MYDVHSTLYYYYYTCASVRMDIAVYIYILNGDVGAALVTWLNSGTV